MSLCQHSVGALFLLISAGLDKDLWGGLRDDPS